MQMAVLLNNFAHAAGLLGGEDGVSQAYGAIRCYTTADALRWGRGRGLQLQKPCGVRIFWHLQQNQENHTDPAWQQAMLALETQVSTLEEFQNIAFSHHLLLQKNP